MVTEQRAKRRERFGDGKANEGTRRRDGPRVAWEGGKIKSNREEALRKFVERKQKMGETLDADAVRAALERKENAEVVVKKKEEEERPVEVRETEAHQPPIHDDEQRDTAGGMDLPDVHGSESKVRRALSACRRSFTSASARARGERREADPPKEPYQAAKKNRKRAERRAKKRTEQQDR